MHVHGAGRGAGVGLPGLLQQLRAAVGAAGMGDEDFQQAELPGREIQALAGAAGLQGDEVEGEGAGAQAGGLLQGLGAAEDRLHAGDELQDREGLHQVVVGAEAEPLHAVGLAPPGGEQQHGHGVPHRPQLLDHLEAVHAGQHQVQHDQAGAVGAVGREGGNAVLGLLDGKALVGKVFHEKPAQAGFVFNHQDVGHGRGSCRAGLPPSPGEWHLARTAFSRRGGARWWR